MNEHTPPMTHWTVETVQALAKELANPEIEVSRDYAASALTWALERIAKVEKDLSESRDDFRALRLDKDRIEAERDAANARAEAAEEVLRQIGDYAHDKSTGPAVPDALWEVREMAYSQLKTQEASK